MNRIAKAIPDSRVKFSKDISKFDYSMLMNREYDFSISADSPVIKAYDFWSHRQFAFDEENNSRKNNQDLFRYMQIREKILEDSGKDIDYVVNTIVAFLYTVRKTSPKNTLWNCFGDVIVENLKKNLEGKGRVCPICGKRFIPVNSLQTTCSRSCHDSMDRELAKIRKVRRIDDI